MRPTGTFGDRRNILFTYKLTGWYVGHCHRQQRRDTLDEFRRWRLGHSQQLAPRNRPDAATETLFDLDASYDVTVGTRPSGRSSVAAGSVAFQSANLTLTGPFSVGGAASLRCPTAQ
ncbi:MAG: hypothetical protein IPM76_24375 [Chloroflexi bacterium]|nr:hypothetical protein [Chloroflexota bacterium]